MLNGEGNAGERWETTIRLMSLITLHVQHTFLYISLPLFFTTTKWNVQKLLSYTFYGRNVVRVIVHCFFTATHFHLALVAAVTKFSCRSPNKKLSPLFFISRSRSLSPFFSLNFAGVPPAFSFSIDFLCLSLSLYSTFVNITFNLTLIL